MTRFLGPESYRAETADWQLLPFRFARLGPDRVLLSNLVGEHLLVSEAELAAITSRELPVDSSFVRRLRSKHMIRAPNDDLPVELLAMKLRTRFAGKARFTGLHIFVVSLRCEHSCPYCQVSRQSSDRDRFDMSIETADRALELVFESPSPQIKIEFQGGEPLLNLPLIDHVVREAEAINLVEGRDLQFVIASNLALLDDSVLDFAARHNIYFSTSLDGPADLHNRNRPRPGSDSWERAVAGIRRIRETLGIDRVAALMTTTQASLDRAREIIDCYLEQGLTTVFLRPLSPYGFAVKTKAHAGYDTQRWLAFYLEGLDYILELNQQGVPMVEQYAAIILKKMLTNQDPGYTDLTSPAGIGIGALVYNYDGLVYASDEGRMLAEMNDTTFKLGDLHQDSYEEIMRSEALLRPLEESFTWSVPMCSDCAFEPYCGADPVFHHATSGDPVGRKPVSAFCTRNMAIFETLITRYHDDPVARDIFTRWAGR